MQIQPHALQRGLKGLFVPAEFSVNLPFSGSPLIRFPAGQNELLQPERARLPAACNAVDSLSSQRPFFLPGP